MVQIPFLQPMVLAALILLIEGTVIGLTRFFMVGTAKMSYGSLLPGQNHGPAWYARLNRVYINGIEAFALFAPACLLHSVGQSTHLSMVATLAWIFVLGRLLYAFVYLSLGYKIWVSFSWLIGFGATLVIWLLLLL